MPRCFAWVLPLSLLSLTSCDEEEASDHPCDGSPIEEGFDRSEEHVDCGGLSSESTEEDSLTVHACIEQALEHRLPFSWIEVHSVGAASSTLLGSAGPGLRARGFPFLMATGSAGIGSSSKTVRGCSAIIERTECEPSSLDVCCTCSGLEEICVQSSP